MKTNSDHMPAALLDLGDGSWHFNYNVQQVGRDEGPGYEYEYDTLHVRGFRYEAIVAAMIRERYTIDEELSIQRQREEKPDEFKEYFDYCEECKSIVKQGLGL